MVSFYFKHIMPHKMHAIFLWVIFTEHINLISCAIFPLSCEPVEDDNYPQITFKVFPESKRSVMITSNTGQIGLCRANKECVVYSPTRYNITVIDYQEYFTVMITIYNVTRTGSDSDSSFWVSLYFHNSFQTEDEICRIMIFSRIQDLQCSNKTSTEGLYVVCSAHKVFPKAVCEFFLYGNKVLSDVSTGISYNHIKFYDDRTYFSTQCTLLVPKIKLSPGLITVQVNMYPNVTGRKDDAKFGINLTQSFSFARPSVELVNCMQTVREGFSVVCKCLPDKSFPSYDFVGWYDENDRLQNNNSYHILSLYAIRNQSAYYCQANNAFGWRSDKKYYNISVLYPPAVLFFTINGYSGDMLVTKSTSRLFLLCESVANPPSDVNIYHGLLLLGQMWNKIEYNYTMTCNSSSVFTCTAEQDERVLNKSIIVNMKCPIELEYPMEKSSVVWLQSPNDTDVSISLNILGYPKPLKYILIKNTTTVITFDNITNGNSFSNGYNIQYIEDVAPYGKVKLTFALSVQNDIPETHYLLLIDNGIDQALTYSFYVTKGRTTNVTSELEIIERARDKINSLNFYAIVGATAVCVTVMSVLVLWRYCKRRGFFGHRYDHVKLQSHLNEDTVYEEIDLNHGADNNIIHVNIVENSEIIEGQYEGRHNYDIIDESLVCVHSRNNKTKTVVRKSSCDIFDTDTFGNGSKLNTVSRNMVGWDTEYITVLDDAIIEDDEYITVIDDIPSFVNEYYTCGEKEYSDDNVYITVVDDPYCKVENSDAKIEANSVV